MTEWLPVNPCEDCSHKNCILDADHCVQLYIYQEKVTVQKELLEYLIAETTRIYFEVGENDFNPAWIIEDTLKPMLAQLEAKQ